MAIISQTILETIESDDRFEVRLSWDPVGEGWRAQMFGSIGPRGAMEPLQGDLLPWAREARPESDDPEKLFDWTVRNHLPKPLFAVESSPQEALDALSELLTRVTVRS